MVGESREIWILRSREVPRPTADEIVSILESREQSTSFSPEDLDTIWKGELESRSIPYIPMVVSKHGHKIGRRDAYADATYRGSPKLPYPYYEVILHPLLLYTNEDYVRRVIRHEISHIVSDEKESY